MTQRRNILGVLLACAFMIAGCGDLGKNVATAPDTGNPPPPPPPTQTVSFSNDLKPIFLRYGCWQCHGGSGGMVIQTVASMLTGGDHGPVFVAGNSSASLIIKKLSPTPPFGDRMPQGGPYLPDSTIQIIKNWIDQGGANN